MTRIINAFVLFCSKICDEQKVGVNEALGRKMKKYVFEKKKRVGVL